MLIIAPFPNTPPGPTDWLFRVKSRSCPGASKSSHRSSIRATFGLSDCHSFGAAPREDVPRRRPHYSDIRHDRHLVIWCWVYLRGKRCSYVGLKLGKKIEMIFCLKVGGLIQGLLDGSEQSWYTQANQRGRVKFKYCDLNIIITEYSRWTTWFDGQTRIRQPGITPRWSFFTQSYLHTLGALGTQSHEKFCLSDAEIWSIRRRWKQLEPLPERGQNLISIPLSIPPLAFRQMRPASF